MSSNLSRSFYNGLKTPNHWEETKLKFILSFSELKSSDWSSEKILSLTQNGLIEKNIIDNEGQVAETYENYNLVNVGNICMNPMDLLSGWVDVSEKRGLISTAYFTFIVNEKFDTKFMNYLLQSNYFKKTFFKLGKGVASHDNFGRWVITPDEIKNFVIFYPSKKEQQEISNYLDKKVKPLNQLIKLINKKIKILQEERKNKLNEYALKGLKQNVIFKDSRVKWLGKIPNNWDVKKIKFVASHVTEKKKSTETDKKISPENVESNTGKILNFYSEYEGEGQKFIKGDILLNKLRIYLNKVVLCDFEGLSMGEMIVIRPSDIFNDYLYCVLSSSKFIDFVNSFSNGVKVPRPSVDKIFNTFIPTPPENEQREIAQYLNVNLSKIDMRIERYKKKINLFLEYRNSLICKLTSGERKPEHE